MKMSFITKLYLVVLLALSVSSVRAQETEGNHVPSNQKACKVWFKHTFSEDSASWTGTCKNGLAEGYGIMVGYTQGKETSRYTGEMKNGKPNGKGKFTFWGNRVLEGNFRDGEPLFLNDTLLHHLKRTIIADTDPQNTYVGDNNQKFLYYDAILPEGPVKGVVVLIPGTWSTTEYLFSSMSQFCRLAYENQLAVIALSINQRLTLTDETLSLMNKMIDNAINTYKLPKNKFVMGGWSMGGLFSLRYTEFAYQDSSKTAVKPLAVFSCDGPCDLANIYNNFKRKLNKNPEQHEPAYGMKELETYCGGTPEQAAEKYAYYSPFTFAKADGGNARYLLKVPVRIYGDVDPVWWMQNRHVDMYDLNALDQTAMIQYLNDQGNSKAEFINAFQKGYRLEGNRHPHSWSIIEPNDCINWILEIIK